MVSKGKVFDQTFFKKFAGSRGGALVALRRVRNSLPYKELCKGVNKANASVRFRVSASQNHRKEGTLCDRERPLIPTHINL